MRWPFFMRRDYTGLCAFAKCVWGLDCAALGCFGLVGYVCGAALIDPPPIFSHALYYNIPAWNV